MADTTGTLRRPASARCRSWARRRATRLRAVPADRATARALGTSPGQPVLQVRRTAIGLGGRPVEYRVSTIVTTAHDYVNLLSRPS